jgi:hypothetical protein
MAEKNLKGTEDKLTYFRFQNTGSFEERYKFIDVSNEPTTKLYYYPEQDKIIFNEDEVRKFSLDQYGQSIPYIEGELTIFNNYFFDFWGYYLTAEGTALFGHLKRYAYGSKDYSYPKIPLICAKMNKSRTTLLRYLDLLERYGFAYQFGVANKSRKELEESSLFKLRKQVPLLPNELVYGDPTIEIPENEPPHIKKALEREKNGLPDILKKEHEKFMKKHLQNSEVLNEKVDFEKIYAAWAHYGELLKRKINSNSVTQHPTAKEMNTEEKILLNFILEQAEQRISQKPFETWFGKISLKIHGNSCTIFAPNELVKDWLQNKYSTLIKEFIEKINEDITILQFDQF